MELLVCNLALVYLAGRQCREQDVVLDTVAPVKGEMSLAPVGAALIGSGQESLKSANKKARLLDATGKMQNYIYLNDLYTHINVQNIPNECHKLFLIDYISQGDMRYRKAWRHSPNCRRFANFSVFIRHKKRHKYPAA